MPSRYELARLAVSDLKEIWAYIAENNSHAADRLIDDFSRKFQLLAQNPAIGRDQSDYIVGMRAYPFKKYLIYYFPTDFGVEIYRVLHGARDIESLFEDFFEGLEP